MLDGVIVCKKGLIDVVSDGKVGYYVAVEGAQKRCGGQGDLMSGILGTFIKYQGNLTEYKDENESAILTVVGASITTRGAAR